MMLASIDHAIHTLIERVQGLWPGKVTAIEAGPVSAQHTITSGGASFWLSAPVVKYSSVSNIFLVVWRGMDTNIWGARLDGNGNLLSAFPITTSQSWQNPSLAWDSVTNQFGVLYRGYGGNLTTAAISIVTAAGTVAATNIFTNNGVTGTFVTDIAYNPSTGHYVGVWFQGKFGTMGAEIASNGTVVALGPVSVTTGTADTIGISYNPASGTFLLVGQGQSYDIFGAELNARGARDSADGQITSTGGPRGTFYPMVSNRSGAAQWNVSTSHNFLELHDQIIVTSTTGGGPAGTLGAAPPPSGGSGGGSTGSCLGSAPFPGAVCVGNGWVPGSVGSSSGGSTGGCPGSAPFAGAVCVNGGWVAGTGGSSGGGTSTGNCLGTVPFPGAVCVSNGWVPGSGASGGSTTSSGNCLGAPPFAGAVCVGNGWVGGSGGSTTSSGNCLGSAPFPGAVCVGNGWVPGSGGSTTSSGSCAGTAPFPGAVCVGNGWVAGSGGSTTTSSGSCLGTAPFPGAVCVGNGWVPGTGTTTDGTCTTPIPSRLLAGAFAATAVGGPGASQSLLDWRHRRAAPNGAAFFCLMEPQWMSCPSQRRTGRGRSVRRIEP